MKEFLKIRQPYGSSQVFQETLLTLLPTQNEGLLAQLFRNPRASGAEENRGSHTSSGWELVAPSPGADRKGA